MKRHDEQVTAGAFERLKGLAKTAALWSFVWIALMVVMAAWDTHISLAAEFPGGGGGGGGITLPVGCKAEEAIG
ncbi:hypothetical protein LCGC14_1801080, partial [marine sediment metagenome]